MPRDWICPSAASGHQPPQLAPCEEQKCRSASDRSRVLPCSIEAIASTSAAQQKETQEPQPPWSFTGVMWFFPLRFRQSTAGSKASAASAASARARRHGGGERGLVDDDAEPAAELVEGRLGERRDPRLPSGIRLCQGLRKRRDLWVGHGVVLLPGSGSAMLGYRMKVSRCSPAVPARTPAGAAVRRARRRPRAGPGRRAAWPWPAAICCRHRHRTAATRPG